MEYRFDAEQEELRLTLRRVLADHARPRAAYDGGPAVDRALWARLAEVGALGFGLDPAEGGSGGGILEQTIVAEELGRALAPVPFLGCAALPAPVLDALASPAQRAELLPGLADGRLLAALAPLPGLAAAPVAGADRLVGRIPLVAEAAEADVALVPFVDAAGPSLAMVRRGQTGVEIRDLPSLDRTRRPAELVLEGASFEPVGAPGAAGRVLVDAANRAAVLLAADATGAAARALELSTEYAKVRRQFDTPIGTFQAVKHMLADMLVAVENARSATYFGAWAIGGRDAEVAAAAAKATATENAVHVVGDAIQVHGGIAITWEHDLHLYLRRVKQDEALFGTPDEHLERVAAHLLDGDLAQT